MTAPWPELSFVGAALGVLALFMFGGNIYVVTRLFPGPSGRPHLGDVVLIAGLLLTAIFLWLSLVYAAISPSAGAWIAVFLALNSMMVVVSAWFIAVMLRAEERPVAPRGWTWPTAFTALVLGNELAMAVAFVLIQTGPDPYLGSGGAGVVGLLADASTSIWFFWSMLGTMAVLVVWVRFPRGERTALLGLTASAAIGPWVVAAPLEGAVGMAGLMAVVFWLLFRELGSDLSPSYLNVARGVILGFTVMAVAEAAFFFDPSSPWAPVPFAVATLGVMGAELLFLSRRALVRPVAGTLPEPFAPSAPAPSDASSSSVPDSPAGG
ncbi:MAG: hypothetical protein L3K17_05830 [Thermoplasmata archaeon]|nr:hypothetical protein [Thermoplasmata archaeon]